VGRAILKAWEFPDELRGVPVGCLDFNRDEGQKADYIDVVTVAKLQCYPDGEGPYKDIDTSTIPAFRKLGLSPEVDVHEVDELAIEVEGAKQAFS